MYVVFAIELEINMLVSCISSWWRQNVIMDDQQVQGLAQVQNPIQSVYEIECEFWAGILGHSTNEKQPYIYIYIQPPTYDHSLHAKRPLRNESITVGHQQFICKNHRLP